VKHWNSERGWSGHSKKQLSLYESLINFLCPIVVLHENEVKALFEKIGSTQPPTGHILPTPETDKTSNDLHTFLLSFLYNHNDHNIKKEIKTDMLKNLYNRVCYIKHQYPGYSNTEELTQSLKYLLSLNVFTKDEIQKGFDKCCKGGKINVVKVLYAQGVIDQTTILNMAATKMCWYYGCRERKDGKPFLYKNVYFYIQKLFKIGFIEAYFKA
jgi:hypothetical protein